MWQWIRRLFGMKEKAERSPGPKRRTALQRLDHTCAHDAIEYERHLQFWKRRHHGGDSDEEPGAKRKPA